MNISYTNDNLICVLVKYINFVPFILGFKEEFDGDCEEINAPHG